MDEKKFKVMNGPEVLAENMSLDNTLSFIKGYSDAHRNDQIILKIHETGTSDIDGN